MERTVSCRSIKKEKNTLLNFQNLSQAFVMHKVPAEECLVLALCDSLSKMIITITAIISYSVLGTSCAFNPHKTLYNTIIIFILQIKKLRNKGVNYLLIHIHPLMEKPGFKARQLEP